MQRTFNRIVLKFGTGILTKPRANTPDQRQISRLTSEVSTAVNAGHQCILVSSGAVGAGLTILGLKDRPRDLPSIQACAAVGQTRLMRLYEGAFRRHQLHVAQLLLTHQDIDSRLRHRNARNTLHQLLSHKNVIPVINENDSVAVDELRFGDNDTLSSEVAMLAEADLLIILSSVDGLTKSPDGRGEVIPVVADIDEVSPYASNRAGRFSVGGMASKLKAVKMAVDAGIPAIIANGRTPGLIPRILRGEPAGTRFLTHQETLPTAAHES